MYQEYVKRRDVSGLRKKSTEKRAKPKKDNAEMILPVINRVDPVMQLKDADVPYVIQYGHEKWDIQLNERLAAVIASLANQKPGGFGPLIPPRLAIYDGLFAQVRDQIQTLTQDEAETLMQNLAEELEHLAGGDTRIDLAACHRRSGTGEAFAVLMGEAGYEEENVRDILSPMELIKNLNKNDVAVFFEQVAILRQYCDVRGIDSVIEGAGKNVKRPTPVTQLNAWYHSHGLNTFIKRLKLMTNYIREIGEQTLEDDKVKDHFLIHSTGSDPHADGRHALFLESKDRDYLSVYYKPHSLHLEDALMGERGLLSRFNEYLPMNSQFATMRISPASHMEQVVERAGTYEDPFQTKVAVAEQYRKLGMLEAAMRFAGITDLHGENVMFTRDGPIPIDAECGGWYGGTGISGVGNISERDEFINPSALYSEYQREGEELPVKRQEMARDQRIFYRYGGRQMERFILDHQEDFLQHYDEMTAKIDRFRIVLVATNILAQNLEEFITGQKNENEIAREQLDTAKRNVSNPMFAFHLQGEDAPRNRLEFTNVFIRQSIIALKQGTLPAYEFIMKEAAGMRPGDILLDGVVVGSLKVADEEGIRALTEVELQARFHGRAEDMVMRVIPAEIQERKQRISNILNIGVDEDIINHIYEFFIWDLNEEDLEEHIREALSEVELENKEAKIQALLRKDSINQILE